MLNSMSVELKVEDSWCSTLNGMRGVKFGVGDLQCSILNGVGGQYSGLQPSFSAFPYTPAEMCLLRVSGKHRSMIALLDCTSSVGPWISHLRVINASAQCEVQDLVVLNPQQHERCRNWGVRLVVLNMRWKTCLVLMIWFERERSDVLHAGITYHRQLHFSPIHPTKSTWFCECGHLSFHQQQMWRPSLWWNAIWRACYQETLMDSCLLVGRGMVNKPCIFQFHPIPSVEKTP